jgi:hypothetical protein
MVSARNLRLAEWAATQNAFRVASWRPQLIICVPSARDHANSRSLDRTPHRSIRLVVGVSYPFEHNVTAISPQQCPAQIISSNTLGVRGCERALPRPNYVPTGDSKTNRLLAPVDRKSASMRTGIGEDRNRRGRRRQLYLRLPSGSARFTQLPLTPVLWYVASLAFRTWISVLMGVSGGIDTLAMRKLVIARYRAEWHG